MGLEVREDLNESAKLALALELKDEHYSYEGLIGHFAKVLVCTTLGSYQGDELFLLQGPPGVFGFLSNGYGSCSGCDSLQGSNTLEEKRELAEELARGVQWGGREEMLEFLTKHDWEGSYYRDGSEEFVVAARKMLEGAQ